VVEGVQVFGLSGRATREMRNDQVSLDCTVVGRKELVLRWESVAGRGEGDARRDGG
jgi:hypothetical protein